MANLLFNIGVDTIFLSYLAVILVIDDVPR